jgi:hypothetical protein
MKKKTLSICIIALTAVLMASSMIAVSQAWWPFYKPEYVGYDFIQVMGDGELISMDASGAPELIIMESTDTMIEGTLTIGDKVYSYPDDFNYRGTIYMELNLITGEGLARIEKTLTFNVPGKPALKSWLVIHMTGLMFDPVTGEIADTENIQSEGDFKLTGTGRFAQVEGFGIEKATHHFGFIKGWPLK